MDAAVLVERLDVVLDEGLGHLALVARRALGLVLARVVVEQLLRPDPVAAVVEQEGLVEGLQVGRQLGHVHHVPRVVLGLEEALLVEAGS